MTATDHDVAFSAQWALPNVAATTKGKTRVASAYTYSISVLYVCNLDQRLTLTLSAPARILPHDTASSGLAPESEPSYCESAHTPPLTE
jgi:hypothetical protein